MTKAYVFNPEDGSLTEQTVPTPAKLAKARKQAIQLEAIGVRADHDCFDNAVPYRIPGVGHGWECGICGALVQTG